MFNISLSSGLADKKYKLKNYNDIDDTGKIYNQSWLIKVGKKYSDE